MSTLTKITTAVNGDTITDDVWNDEFDQIYGDYNGGITNANLSASAGIAYSKLNLTGNILNADINASAAIAYTKLNLTGAILDADLAGSISASKITDTAITQTATQTLTNKTLTKPAFQASYHTPTAATVSGSYQMDFAATNVYELTLSASTILSVTNETVGQPLVVHLVQGSGGSKLVTWWSNITWMGGSSPTLSTTATWVDTVCFLKRSNGNYLGYIVGLGAR